MPLTPPFTLLDRYDVEAEIGRGANAMVFRARDRVLGREVAIKLIRDDVLSPANVARFQREIHLTAGLEHRHILHVYDTGTFEGRPFVVMELAAGRSLAHRLSAEGQLPIADAVRIATDIGHALHHAHENGIVHRDVKPDNILLNDGSAFLGDFGIARAAQSELAERLTSTGVAVGTVLYMSPEQLMADRDVDGRSDQYSLACVLYEMLAGVRPHIAASMEALRVMRTMGNQLPVRTHRPTVPIALNNAIERALAPIPADRFPTLEAFVQALHDDSGITADRPSIGSTHIQRRPRRVGRAIALICGLVLLPVAAFQVYNTAQPTNGDPATTFVTFASGAAIDGASAPEANFVQLLREEIGGWSDVQVVDKVNAGDAGHLSIQTTVTPAGDSSRVRMTVAQGKSKRSIVLMMRSADIAAGSAVFATLAREVLSGSDSLAAPGIQGLTSRSTAALRNYAAGHASLRAGMLDSAQAQFRRAHNAAGEFAQAALWAAEVGALIAPRAVGEWKRYAEDAVAARKLSGADSSFAAALLAMSNGAYPDACIAFRDVALRGSATVRFLGWYGLGECSRLDSTVVRTDKGWQFRSSHWSALQAYVESVQRAPTSPLFAALYPRAMALSYAEDSRIRQGASEGPNPMYFAAYPSLDTDTLAFFPLPRDAVYRMSTGTVPTSLENARDRGRAVAIKIAEAWVQHDRTSADAWLARAVALELAGNINADDPEFSATFAIAQAEQYAGPAASPLLKLRILIVRARTTLRRGDIAGAVAASEKALDLQHDVAPRDRFMLAPLAAFVGKTNLAAELGYSEQYAPGIRPELAREVFSLHMQALGNECAGLRQSSETVKTHFRNRVPKADQAHLADAILKPVLRVAVPCLGPEVLNEFDPVLPIDLAYASLVRGDTAGAQKILREQLRGRTGFDLASMTRDYIWSETWALFQVGDSATARERLINPLEYLSSMSISTLDQIPQAAGLRNALLLTVRLASAGDTTAAIRKWSKRAAVLSNIH